VRADGSIADEPTDATPDSERAIGVSEAEQAPASEVESTRDAPSAETRRGPVPAPSRIARAGAKPAADRPRPEPRPRTRRADRSAPTERAGRSGRTETADRDGASDRVTSTVREPFDSHTPGPTDDHERGLRGLIGGGSSQVSVAAAMRARDASRPSEADIANAEQTLPIVHRGWVPRD